MLVDSTNQVNKLSLGTTGSHHHRTINAGPSSNPHSALRTKENNCQLGGP